ncbi:TRAP transporter small permease [Marinomonas algicola]|uniref:TRAP transporter small permease n=1 Tax=Marinomonas algicola TaxID=2773454 RepID=UPI00174D9E5C|nr:TRAP transporter small permease subunit [Marinomonas algicola]
MLKHLSNLIFRAEVVLASSMAAIVTLLILINIISRAFGHAIYWVDELAIYSMIWMTFFATSVLLKKRDSIAVTILTDLVSDKVKVWLTLLSDLMVLLFAVIMVWLCYRWFAPIELYQEKFDIVSFQGETFNFMYSEKTSTLGMSKFWVWLILPIFSVSLLLHSFTNILQLFLSTTIKKEAPL